MSNFDAKIAKIHPTWKANFDKRSHLIHDDYEEEAAELTEAIESDDFDGYRNAQIMLEASDVLCTMMRALKCQVSNAVDLALLLEVSAAKLALPYEDRHDARDIVYNILASRGIK